MAARREPKRSADSESTRRQLVEAGVQLLARRGPERVNTNQIARAAGVGVGTFYAHFADKFEFIQATTLLALEELGRVIDAAVGRPTRDRAEQVRHSIEAVLDWAEQHRDLFRVAFGREGAPLGGGRPHVVYSPRRLERRLLGLQVQGRLDPAIDPTIAAKAFTAMQNAVIIWWLESPERASRDRVLDTLTRLHPAVAGATPTPDSRSRAPAVQPMGGAAPAG